MGSNPMDTRIWAEPMVRRMQSFAMYKVKMPNIRPMATIIEILNINNHGHHNHHLQPVAQSDDPSLRATAHTENTIAQSDDPSLRATLGSKIRIKDDESSLCATARR